jgi:solute carrier family 30 (zinc transporter), member 2
MTSSSSSSSASLLEPILLGDAKHLRVKRKLEKSMMIAIVFMLLEVIGGLMAGSLAIVSDAAHVLSDVSGLAVSLFAISIIAKKPKSANYTYGYNQAEVLGALGSVMLVWAMTGILLFEAYCRFINLQEIDSQLMMIMALIGLLVNITMMATLGHDHTHGHPVIHEQHVHGEHCHNHSHGHHPHSHSHAPNSMLLSAAMVHMIGDILQSIGVLVASVFIHYKPIDIGYTSTGISKWNYADPLCTVLFSILVMYTTMSTMRQCIDVLMHKVPADIDVTSFEYKLKQIPSVLCIHDIHIWSISNTSYICTAHISIQDKLGSTEMMGILQQAINIAQSLNIQHSTFQLEIQSEFNHKHLESYGDACYGKADCC